MIAPSVAPASSRCARPGQPRRRVRLRHRRRRVQSGCVLANRLSANPRNRVLLIEAGGPEDQSPAFATPGKWTSLLGSALDWDYSTEPEAGLGGRAIKWPRGKSHGGSSAINAMAYIRGHRLCYRAWAAKPAGRSGATTRCCPYFRRVEDNSRGASDYHGAGRPARGDRHDRSARRSPGVSRGRARARLRRHARTSISTAPGRSSGAGFYQKNISGGRRHSAAAAFLVPALARSESRRVVAARRRFASRFRACARRAWTCCAPARACTRAPARGHSQRRRHRIAEAADAVRHRSRGRAASARIPFSTDAARRRRRICRITLRVSVRWAARSSRSRHRRCRRACSRFRQRRGRARATRRRISSFMWDAGSTCPIHSSR